MFEILVGDWGILAALVIMLLVAMRAYRSTMEIMLFDRAPAYRMLTRASFGAVAAVLLWVTIFDNWRQLLGAVTTYTHDEKTGRASDPFGTAATGDFERAVSWILFGLMVLGTAYLFARYARGYWGPAIATPVALALYYIFNAFRIRFDVDSVRIADASITNVADIASTLIWIIGLWGTFAMLILCLFLLFWGPTAIIMSIIYRSTLGKVVFEEPDMYRIIRERSEARKRAAEQGRHTTL